MCLLHLTVCCVSRWRPRDHEHELKTYWISFSLVFGPVLVAVAASLTLSLPSLALAAVVVLLACILEVICLYPTLAPLMRREEPALMIVCDPDGDDPRLDPSGGGGGDDGDDDDDGSVSDTSGSGSGSDSGGSSGSGSGSGEDEIV